jgi:hypothetical protein
MPRIVASATCRCGLTGRRVSLLALERLNRAARSRSRRANWGHQNYEFAGNWRILRCAPMLSREGPATMTQSVAESPLLCRRPQPVINPHGARLGSCESANHAGCYGRTGRIAFVKLTIA